MHGRFYLDINWWTKGAIEKSGISFQCLKKVEKSHSTFITGLEFLPTSEEADVIRGFSDASVVSISVDHQICVHHIPRLSEYISFVYFKFTIKSYLEIYCCWDKDVSLFITRTNIDGRGHVHPRYFAHHNLHNMQLPRSLNVHKKSLIIISGKSLLFIFMCIRMLCMQ